MSATRAAGAPASRTVRFAGFGGQGIVKTGEILGAAAIAMGRRALQTESYGSSARGGLCTSDVVIGAGETGEIHEIEPDEFDVLVALSQDSLGAFLKQLKPGGLLVYEEELVRLPAEYAGRAYAVPATRIAAQELGRRIVMNMVVLGFVCALGDLGDRARFEATVAANVPRGTEELNQRAFGEGWARGVAARG